MKLPANFHKSSQNLDSRFQICGIGACLLEHVVRKAAAAAPCSLGAPVNELRGSGGGGRHHHLLLLRVAIQLLKFPLEFPLEKPLEFLLEFPLDSTAKTVPFLYCQSNPDSIGKKSA